MNNESVDMDRMRKAWEEMGKALGKQPIRDNDPRDFNKKKTALDRLREKYCTFWIISLVMTFGGFLIFSGNTLIASPLNFWLGAAFSVYFLTAFCMDFWLWRGIGAIDPLRMSVSEISGRSMFYRKRHLQFMAVIIPMAIALMCFTGYVFSSETYFLSGMIFGIIIGLIIGTIQFRRFMAEYRNLES